MTTGCQTQPHYRRPVCPSCEEAEVSLTVSKDNYFRFIWKCYNCNETFDHRTGNEVTLATVKKGDLGYGSR